MDPVTLTIILVGITAAGIFNYILNRAPGAEPEDFEFGPSGMAIRCDCVMNIFVIAAIVVLALALSSAAFSSRAELYGTGFLTFLAITLAGLLGRRRRHREWREIEVILERVVPDDYLDQTEEDYMGTPSDEDDEDSDEDVMF
jgi:hypothetical protein